MNLDNLSFVDDLVKNIDKGMPNARELIYIFTITFARFEYSLKEIPQFLKDGDIAEANWEEYSKSIDSRRFYLNLDDDVKESMDFILTYPPRTLVNNDKEKEWKDSYKRSSKICTLVRYLCVVRNNLLHGNKFDGKFNEGTRNYKLITSCIILMNYLLTLDKTVSDHFKGWTA